MGLIVWAVNRHQTHMCLCCSRSHNTVVEVSLCKEKQHRSNDLFCLVIMREETYQYKILNIVSIGP